VLGNHNYLVLTPESPLMFNAYGEEAMWQILDQEENTVRTTCGKDVALQAVAPLWEWFGAQELIYSFRFVKRPLWAFETVLKKVIQGWHGKTLYFWSDHGPVRMYIDGDAPKYYLLTEMTVISFSHELNEIVTYFLTSERFGTLEAKERLQLMEEVRNTARISGHDPAGEYSIDWTVSAARDRHGEEQVFAGLNKLEIRAMAQRVRTAFQAGERANK
jgi:hypothetical protein